MASTLTRDRRLALRMTASERIVIEQASQVVGESMTRFSVSAAIDRAERILADQQHWVLSATEWDEFVEALDHPAQVLPGLAKLMSQPSVFE